jgi:uncharacterized protein
MGRVLFWILLGVAVWVGWRLWKDKQRLQVRRDADEAHRAVEGEVLVECRQCGVRVPRSAAVRDADTWFCSAQHRDEYAGTR